MGAEGEKAQPGTGSQTIDKPKPKSNPNSLISETQFAAWKLRKDAETSARKVEVERKRAADIASGLVQMNGRELFIHEPWVFDNSRY